MVGGDGVGGECAVSVELLWNRLSGFISPSHLYLRRNVASGLKPISITFLHFINFRTITRELPFDSRSSSLSCTSKRSLRERGCETSLILRSVFPLIAKHCVSALFSLVPKVCAVHVSVSDFRCLGLCLNLHDIHTKDKSQHKYPVKTLVYPLWISDHLLRENPR